MHRCRAVGCRFRRPTGAKEAVEPERAPQRAHLRRHDRRLPRRHHSGVARDRVRREPEERKASAGRSRSAPQATAGVAAGRRGRSAFRKLDRGRPAIARRSQRSTVQPRVLQVVQQTVCRPSLSVISPDPLQARQVLADGGRLGARWRSSGWRRAAWTYANSRSSGFAR
jgi:hypothetical protein